MKDNRFFESWVPVVFSYLLSAAMLGFGVYSSSIWPLYVMIAYFTLWDMFWVFTARIDRSPQETLEAATRARMYISYFVVLYGAAIVYYIEKYSETDKSEFVRLFTEANIPAWLILAPLGLWAVALMFFPVTVSAEREGDWPRRKPSPANLSVMIVNVWVQKVGTYVFAYCILAAALAATH